ncbi:MAG: hypothetical protein Q4B85_01530 [Lachnospiraceae bacterium]|nr:hypothetical protein [Lachnospiraceae bacterium]
MSYLVYIFRPLCITIVLETLVAVLWGIRTRRELLVVLLVNSITNPVVNLILGYVMFYGQMEGYRGTLVVLELLVFFTEGVLFRIFLPQLKHPFLFSACLNAGSFFGGKAVRGMGRSIAAFLTPGNGGIRSGMEIPK